MYGIVFLLVGIGIVILNHFCWMQVAADVDSDVFETYLWQQRLPFPPGARQLLREHHTKFPSSKLGILTACTTVISVITYLALLIIVCWLVTHKGVGSRFQRADKPY
jgi:hypothetical protein